jgi:hypothetical protein
LRDRVVVFKVHPVTALCAGIKNIEEQETGDDSLLHEGRFYDDQSNCNIVGSQAASKKD